jgi:hypothetical protein
MTDLVTAPRIMRDSVKAARIPHLGLDMVAGYVNGAWPWSDADWDSFVGLPQVRINVTGEPGRGNMLDVERYDATPEHAPGWWDSVTWCPKRDLGVYCSWNSLADVIRYMGGRDWKLWLASPDHLGRFHGVAALQRTGWPGPEYDESIVYDAGWLPPSPF